MTTFAIQGRKRSFGHVTEHLRSAEGVRAPDHSSDGNWRGSATASPAWRAAGPPCRSRAPSGACCPATHGRAAASLRRASRPTSGGTCSARRSTRSAHRATRRRCATPTHGTTAFRRAARSVACRCCTARSAPCHLARCAARGPAARCSTWFAAGRLRTDEATRAQQAGAPACRSPEGQRRTQQKLRRAKCARAQRSERGGAAGGSATAASS